MFNIGMVSIEIREVFEVKLTSFGFDFNEFIKLFSVSYRIEVMYIRIVQLSTYDMFLTKVTFFMLTILLTFY